MWFKYNDTFYHGLARVQREDNKWNYIDEKGNLLSPNRWFNYNVAFYYSFASVQREDKLWNIIDTNGNILSPNQWFTSIRINNNLIRAYFKDNTFYFDNNNKLHKQILNSHS